MQAVVIAFLVAQQQRGGPLLSAAMALLEKRIQIGGEIRWDSQRGHPIVRCWSKKTIELFTKLGDERRQGIGKILVITSAEAIAFQFDAATKQLCIGLHSTQILAH